MVYGIEGDADSSRPARIRAAGQARRSHRPDGRPVANDPDLAASAQRGLDAVVRLVLERFDDELAALVSGTIGRWDAVETSRRLELLLGPDLQYIRINGTIVGGLAGLALHAISQAAG